MNKSYNITESRLLKRGTGNVKGIIVNSHTSGTLKLVDGLSNGAAASAVLTSAGACVPASHGQNVLTSTGAMVAGTHPVSVMTGDAIVAGNVVVIGTITYTFVNSLSGVAYQVLVGATLTESLANLKAAINHEAGRGTLYSAGTIAHPLVICVAADATTITVRGRVPGTSLNATATTGTALRTVWADTTLGGGTGASDAGVTTAAATVTIGAITYTVVDELSEVYGAAAIAYQVKKGADEAAMLDNLKLAINGGAGAGTLYSTGTIAHTQFIATTNTDTAQTIIARAVGNAAYTTAINALATTETMANMSWADTTFGGGTGNSNPAVTSDNAKFTIGDRTYTAVIELSEASGATAVADQILWVTSEAVFLDNVKKAINGSGLAATDYSTGTYPHLSVLATTNTDTAQTFVARDIGTQGNSIATTETLGNYSFAGTTMASGTGTIGRILVNTITFAAGERFVPIYDAEFTDGLLAIIGGTADLTIVT